jgi:hypothetical protein
MGRVKGVCSATLVPLWTKMRGEAKRQGIKTPVLIYDWATAHTSKKTQEELGRIFGKDSHEAQAPKSPDINNGD